MKCDFVSFIGKWLQAGRLYVCIRRRKIVEDTLHAHSMLANNRISDFVRLSFI